MFSHIEGKLTLGGALEVANLGGLEPGTYKLFDLSGAVAPTGAFSATNMPSGFDGSVAIVGVDVELTVTSSAAVGTVVTIQ